MSLKPQPGRPSMAPNRPGDRPSGMGVDPRRSSAFGKANNGLKQDPRPLGDKNFFNSCIRTVITYMSTHGYPYALSPKLLASPTGKDFAQMVQFLFQKFDPALGKVAFGKVEDEVPLFFKRLNYPFQVREGRPLFRRQRIRSAWPWHAARSCIAAHRSTTGARIDQWLSDVIEGVIAMTRGWQVIVDGLMVASVGDHGNA